MATYVSTVSDVIKQLRMRLDEYAFGDHGLTVVKELVQNADDARAERLEFILLERGIEGAENPLLRGPALLVFNNGPFEPAHARRFTQPAGTSKSRDATAIGRFGIGQQSVFHLCEAWFYLGRSREYPDVIADVIDPWADPSVVDPRKADVQRPDWNVFGPADRVRVLDALGERTQASGWLALWLPLRKEEHRRAPGGFISNRVWSTTQLQADLADLSPLVEVIPQLRTLADIRVFRAASPYSASESVTRVSLAPGSTRLGRPLMGESLEARGSGEVLFQTGDQEAIPYRFLLHQHTVEDATLRALARHPGWPTVPIDENGETREEPEKVVAHGAITVIRGPASSGGAAWPSAAVSLGWGIYLPIGRPESEPLPAGVDGAWSLLLHGAFFPDHGRRWPLGFGSAPLTAPDLDALRRPDPDPRAGGTSSGALDDWFRLQWNARLRDAATLPLLLPILAEALGTLGIQEAEGVLRAVASAPTVQNHQAVAGRRDQVVVRVERTGPVVRLRPRHSTVLKIPRATAGSPAWTRAVVPVLDALEAAGQVVDLTFDDAPRIAADPVGSWTDAALTAALSDDVLQGVGRSPEAVTWLAAWLSDAHRSEPSLIRRHVLGVLARAVRLLGEETLRHASVRDGWARIASLLPASQLIPTSAHRAIAIAGPAFDSVVLLPEELAHHDSAARPAWTDAEWRSALKRLSAAVVDGVSAGDDAAVRACGQLAGEIVSILGARTVTEDPALRELTLFRVHSVRHREKQFVSAAAMLRTCERHLAFSRAGMASPDLVCQRLLAAIEGPDHDVLLLEDPDVAAALRVPDLSEAGLLACFSGADALTPAGDTQPRRDLLDTVLSKRMLEVTTPEFGAFRAAVRWLLSGNRRAELRTFELLVRESALKLDEPLCRAVLAMRDRAWTLLSPLIAGVLTQDWKERLGVRSLREEDLLHDLHEAEDEPLGRLCGSMELEHLEAIARFSARDETLWRRLPVHETTGGARVAARGNLFREEQAFPVPEVLRAEVYILVPARDVEASTWQRQRVPAWSAADQIRIALDLAEQGVPAGPVLVARAILDGLAVLEPTPADHRLASTAWLPTRSGHQVAPRDLLSLPAGVAKCVRGFLRGDEEVFVLPEEVDEDCRTHAIFPRVSAWGAGEARAAVDALGLRLAQLPDEGRVDLRLAPHVCDLPPEELVARTLAAPRHRGLALVRAVRVEVGGELPTELRRALCGTFTERQHAALLEFFGEAARLQGADPDVEEPLFRHYLTLLAPSVASDERRQVVLSSLSLKNCAGAWKPAGSLTVAPNVADEYRLDEKQAGALRLRAEQGGLRSPAALPSAPPGVEVKAAASVLEAHFRAWFSSPVPMPALGALVALLGDGVEGSVRELATRWLGAHATVEGVREELALGWSAVLSTATDGDHLHLSRARLAVCSAREGQRVEVASLLGEPLLAEVGGSGPVRTLLVRPLRGTDAPQWVVLRWFDPSARSREDLLDILRKTIDDVFVGLTRHRPGPGFERLWQRLRPEAQVDVEVVRGQIRRELGAQLRNLGCSAESGDARELSARLRELRRCEQRLDELAAEDARDPGGSSHRVHLRNRATVEHEAARRALEQLVEEDPVVNRFLLGRVRRQLEKAQYGPERVPFELFQNADDAVVQLERMLAAEGRPLPDACRRFEVQLPGGEGQALRVWHWGRGINRHYLGSGFKDGRELGYDRDLLHMMLLHASDKGEQGGTTGQFGLGFKAVHLVSDAPRVQSEGIAFEVRAGFVPVPTALTPAWTRRRVDDFLPTVVELPASVALGPKSITSRFQECGGLLPVFAQAIREVALQGTVAMSPSSWSPRVLHLPGHRVEVGDVRVDLSRPESTRLLVVRRQEGNGPVPAAVFLLTGGSVGTLGVRVPTFWTTAPTDVCCATGWCINGPFAVDVGRTQLGQTDQHRAANLEVADTLGRTVSDALVALYDALTTREDDVAASIGLPFANKAYQAERFWTSVWSRLTAGTSHPTAHDEIVKVLTQAWTEYIRARPALPTGLDGAWRALTRLEDVRFVADEVLGRPEVARTVGGWPWVLSRWPIGQVVTGEVARMLTELHGVTAAPLTLARLVDAAHAGVDPVPLPTLQALAPVYRWLNDEAQPLPPAERDRVRECLANLPLRSHAGKARRAAELLLPALGADAREDVRSKGGSRAADDIDLLADDARLAAFAVADRLLAPDLFDDPDALLLYLEGRRKRKTPIDINEVASWAREASEPSAQRAALLYLVEGERRGPLANALHERLPPWAASEASLVASGLLDDFTSAQQVSVKLALFGSPVTVIWGPPVPLPPAPPPRPPAASVLRAIADWWAGTRMPIEARWEGRVYPEWLPADQLKPRLLARDDEAWLLLLSLGMCQRIGRTQPGAAPGFIDRLRDFQWWPEMVSSSEAEPWIVGLEGWLTSEVEHREFDRWLELLPWMWQARRWLDEYRRLLLNADRTIEGRGVMGLWRPGTNPVLEGSDIDPPPFNALTSVGGRWVLRELLRQGVVPATQTLRRAAFVPHLSTRRFLDELGLPLDRTGNAHDASERIHDFLVEHLPDDPTFGGAYDLPLHILSRHPVLRERALAGELGPGDGEDDLGQLEPEPED